MTTNIDDLKNLPAQERTSIESNINSSIKLIDSGRMSHEELADKLGGSVIKFHKTFSIPRIRDN